MCLALARLEAGVDAGDEPYWKADEALSEETLAALRASVVPPDIEPMREAALALVDLYRLIAPAVAAGHGTAYPAVLDQLISARLRAPGTGRGQPTDAGERAS